MFKIGFVDLDTSHPGAFAEFINKHIDNVKIAACWDGGTVYPSGYADGFAQKHGIPLVCNTLDEMVEAVDAVFILGVNWDLHIERALPFVKAGKGVFIDKPVVGNIRDLGKYRQLASQGTPVVGGSSVRFAREVEQIKRTAHEQNGPLSILASTSGDFFSYGIHGIEMVGGLLGAGFYSVEYLSGSNPANFYLEHHSGCGVCLQLMTPAYGFHITVTTKDGVYPVSVGSHNLYEPMLRKVIAYLKGDGPEPVYPEETADSILVALACKRAYEKGPGTKVRLDRLTDEEPGFDGAQFATEYQRERLGK